MTRHSTHRLQNQTNLSRDQFNVTTPKNILILMVDFYSTFDRGVLGLE